MGPELGVRLEPLAVAFHEAAMIFVGASVIASCLNLLLELTTHKYLYKYSMFVSNTLVEPFRAFLLLQVSH